MSQILSHLLWPGGWHVASGIGLTLIRSPTQNVAMGLVVKLQIMQQLTTLVTFSQIQQL